MLSKSWLFSFSDHPAVKSYKVYLFCDILITAMFIFFMAIAVASISTYVYKYVIHKIAISYGLL